MDIYWMYEWDGTPGKSTKVHQLVKDGLTVAYITQEPGEAFGAEFAYIRGEYKPVSVSSDPSIDSIKKGLENWARRGLI